MKTKQDILCENRVGVILTFILIILYIITLVKLTPEDIWEWISSDFIVVLMCYIGITLPFIAAFMGIWKDINK